MVLDSILGLKLKVNEAGLVEDLFLHLMNLSGLETRQFERFVLFLAPRPNWNPSSHMTSHI